MGVANWHPRRPAAACQERFSLIAPLSLYIILIARERVSGQLSKSNRALPLLVFQSAHEICAASFVPFFLSATHDSTLVYFVSGHFPRVDLWILSLLPLWLRLIYELRANTVLHEILLLKAVLWKSGFLVQLFIIR
jgi:hypothetical protein